MSRKIPGELPLRLVAAADVNPFLRAQGRPELGPGLVLVSRTLAARFDIAAGDRVLIHTEEELHRFRITEVADDLGFFADDGQYVDLKSYLVFSDGNPLFDGPLAESLGKYAALRKIGGGRPADADVDALSAFYHPVRYGWYLAEQQQGEIDRDFTIFDFILAMTLVLAAVGVANVILIQVIDRQRELSVLRSLGVSRLQTTRTLIAEGAVIGLVSGLLSLVLGHAFGAVSVAFLDRFTLFDYRLVLSPAASAGMVLMAVLVCSLAAIYPALVASRVSSAESLHYE
jgi:ABC-type antimicrobial peptide transport system permease subunit